MNDFVREMLEAARDVWAAPPFVSDLDALARAVGVYPVARMEDYASAVDFPPKGPEGWSTRAVREWLEYRESAARDAPAL